MYQNIQLYIFMMITQSRLYLNFGLAKTMVPVPGQKKTKNFHKLVEKHCIPNKMEYDFLEAREMCSGIESLIKAREKAKKAMFVSDLSDDDDKANRKFKHKKTPYSTASLSLCPIYLDSDVTENNAAINTSIKPNTKMINHDAQLFQSPSPKKCKQIIESKPNGWSPSPLKASASKVARKLSYDKSPKSTSIKKPVKQLTIFDKLLSDGDDNMSADGADGYYMTKINTPISSSKVEIINSSVTDKSQDKSSQKMLKAILRNIIYLQTDIKHIEIKQNEILNKLESIESNYGNNSEQDDSNNVNELQDCNFPIDDLYNLNIIEDQINTNLNFKKCLVQYLSYLGGNNINCTMKRILMKLFTDNLLSLFSYNGKKGKKKFCDLIICPVIFDAVKCQSKSMNVSQNELESRIKYHLAQAPFNIKKNNKLGLNAEAVD